MNLTDWAKTAKAGERFEYFRGSVAGTRSAYPWLSSLADANKAWNLAMSGQFTLTQRKLGPGIYGYVITKLKKRVDMAKFQDFFRE